MRIAFTSSPSRATSCREGALSNSSQRHNLPAEAQQWMQLSANVSTGEKKSIVNTSLPRVHMHACACSLLRHALQLEAEEGRGRTDEDAGGEARYE